MGRPRDTRGWRQHLWLHLRLKRLGLTRAELARRAGWSRRKLGRVLDGEMLLEEVPPAELAPLGEALGWPEDPVLALLRRPLPFYDDLTTRFAAEVPPPPAGYALVHAPAGLARPLEICRLKHEDLQTRQDRLPAGWILCGPGGVPNTRQVQTEPRVHLGGERPEGIASVLAWFGTIEILEEN